MSQELAKKIVDEILEDLTDRRGLRHEWEQIDEDIQQEIVQVWTEIVDRNIAEEGQP